MKYYIKFELHLIITEEKSPSVNLILINAN